MNRLCRMELHPAQFFKERCDTMICNVMDFGCRADGVALDSPAIQAAINTCSQNGGGKVWIPAGQYLVGKMELKDHVTVEIGEGAWLIASPNREDYPLSPGFPESLYNRGHDLGDSRAERIALFYACGAKNIGITGRGTVDGRHEQFLVKNAYPSTNVPRWINATYDVDRYYASGEGFKFRILLVFFENCEDIVLDGVNYRNSSCYTLQLRSSRQIQITNVVIRNHLMADNADGIHMSSCTDVRISNCDLECGDDCIAIDSNDMRPARNFLVQNCTFISRNNCFRIFTNLAPQEIKRKLVGWGKVSDIVINNCVVKDASSFVYINGDCGELKRISVTNASGVIKRLGTTFLITAHNAKVRQVTFSNWNFLSRGVGYIYADRPDSITGIKLDNLDIHVEPSTQAYGNGLYMPAAENGKPEYWLSHYVPYFLQMVETDRVTVRDLRVTWGETDLEDIVEITPEKMEGYGLPMPVSNEPHWPAVWAERVCNLMLDNCSFCAFGDHPYALRLDAVNHAVVRDCGITDQTIFVSDNSSDVRIRNT